MIKPREMQNPVNDQMSEVVLKAFILLIGFGAYLFHATLQTHATQMAPRARGSAVALFACCLFGGQAAGTSGAAALVDHAGFVPLLLCAALGLAAAGSAFASALARRR